MIMLLVSGRYLCRQSLLKRSGAEIKFSRNMATTYERQFQIRARNNQYEDLTKEKEGEWKGPFFFVQGADPQFGMIESFIRKNPIPSWTEEIELSRKAVAAINELQPRPKFFIICGDLLDAWPATQKDVRVQQEVDFKKIFGEVHPDIPLICLCGNHDVGNVPTRAAVELYRSSFGDDYFSFWAGGVFCIVLNSQYFTPDVSEVQDFVDQQASWLEDQLVIAKKAKHALVFQHIPWFLNKPDEPFNPYFTIDLPIRTKMMEKFKQAGIKTIFCGHYHRNAGGFDGNMEVVVTSAIGAQLGKDKSGLRIVHVNTKSITHEYYELDKMPKSVKIK